MRILLTGVTGVVGRAVARQLLAAGYAVSGIAAHPHENLDPGVDFVCGPLDGPTLQQLADDSDVVLHLAPIETTAPGSAGISGLVRVAHAAARAGARLIYVSQAAGQPSLYRHAESLASTGWAPSLIVRKAPLMGRQLDWMTCRTLGSLLHSRDSATPLRLLHFDDLLRFLVLAVMTNRTGQVDLAPGDTTEVATARRLLRSIEQRPRLARLPTWPQLIPELDVAVVRDAWQFEFGWRASDVVADTVRGLAGRRLDVRGAVDLPGHLPIPLEVAPRTDPSDGTQLRSAAPDGLEGEFDDRIDPRFPVFSAATLGQTLPGPLTPMTLDVQLAGLRTANRMMSQVMAVGDVVASEWGSRAIAVFGHRPYVGVSASVIAAGQLPGWDVGAVVQQSLVGSPADALLPLGRPPLAGGLLGSGNKATKVMAIKRAMALLRHLRADTEAYVAAATAEHLGAAQLKPPSDADLQVRTRLLRDRIHQGWGLTGLWLIDTGITAATVERTGLHTAVSGVAALLESDVVEAKTSALAALIRSDPQLCRLALDADLNGIGVLSRSTAAAFTAAVARIGHRGPGEVELANLMFVDDPAMLLVAAGRAAIAVPRPMASDASATKLGERMAASARASRELAYDTTMRFTHELRMTLRELGSRLAAADVIDVAGEIFYLTCDEVVTLPADARLRIKRRRAERERLQGMQLPDLIGIS
ncbi:MAG: NAD-dependent epimerase/dehydratase family protein [Mycobacterium sp.]|uniref:NAD-dependent epimerase/dehydratase family protein n=1 Tax=Mycobacterium sp. TaxID=1785 RepID=UPI003BB096BC